MEMGRRRSETVESPRALEAPFPSNPNRPAKVVFYVSWKERIQVVAFSAWYAARHYIEACQESSGAQSYKFKKRKTASGYVIRHGIEFDNGLRIECQSREELDNAIEYNWKAGEEEWRLPSPYPEHIHMLFNERAERVDTPKEKARIERQRVDKSGLISINQLCEELNIVPRLARGVLRASIPKPAVGWAWSPDDIEAIKKLLKDKL
jgi:hypothetical protein